MRNFYSFLEKENLKNSVAIAMVNNKVDPYFYIDNYLNGTINEGWTDSFLKRIGNAWKSFWDDGVTKNNDSPLARLESAKKSLNDLHQLVATNSGVEPGNNNIDIILKGLANSLDILSKIQPILQKYDSSLLNYQQTGVPHSSGDDDGLPKEFHDRYAQIVSKLNGIISQPDTAQKYDLLMTNGDELTKFIAELENHYQQLNPKNQSEMQAKRQIYNFLTSIDKDAALREVEKLLNNARRTNGGLSVERPQEIIKKVTDQWHEISQKPIDNNAKKRMFVNWYSSLPANDPVRSFVVKDMKDHGLQGNETDVFWKYAVEWINKYPHYASKSEG